MTDTNSRSRRFNKKQKAWLAQYEKATGFEPMYLEDFRSGTTTWGELMKENLCWLELHYQECYEGADSWNHWE